MENISNQISYLKGLMEGLKFDENSNEGKIFKAILNVLEEIDYSMDDIYDYQDELAEQVDMIDDDLAAVEEEFADCDECCGCDDDDEYYEVECPSCGEVICLDEDVLCNGDDIICPNCKEPIELDFDCDCDSDDCCDHE